MTEARQRNFLFCFIILIGVVSSELILPAGIEQETYCKTCKAVSQGMWRFNNDNKDWIEETPCKETYLLHSSVTAVNKKEISKLKRTCFHLMEHYSEEIEEKVQTLSKVNFSAWLCNEQSYACMGLSYDKYEGANTSPADGTDDEAIKKLIQKNKHRIKTPYPHKYKEEL